LRSRRLLSCLILGCTSFTVSSNAQNSVEVDNPRFLAPATTIEKRVDEVNLAFTVTDKKGRFVSDLQSHDFQLLDNHLEPQRLTYFQQRSDLPLHVAVVVDASSSVSYRFRFEQDAAVSFLKKILRPGKDKAFVVAFNDRVNTVQDVTDRTDRLSKVLRKVKAEGNTALHDAVIYASEKLHRMGENQLTRRAIVLISDGVDTVNSSTLQQAEKAASHAEVMIFALSTNYSANDPNGNGDDVLKELASTTGGTLLQAHEESQLAAAFRNVEKALRNQYVVAYSPPAFQADGSYRTVEVIPRKHGLRTSCRKGYYAKILAIK
jgi:Ca-activated chloride channel family protein